MGKVLSLILLCIAAFALADASAEPLKGTNSPEAIEKCKRELEACKSNCDKTIIDVDDNVDRCKQGCDDADNMCLQYRIGGPAAGNRADAPTPRRRDPPAAEIIPTSNKVCCAHGGGRFTWSSYARCKRYGNKAVEPRKCTAAPKSP
jgi:hypothetical protein